jgi:hypothetical protein
MPPSDIEQVLHAIQRSTPIPDDCLDDYHADCTRICKRFGLPTVDYYKLCIIERQLHRWHEAECNGEIQWDEEGSPPLPYAYNPDRFGTPMIRSREPLPNLEQQLTAQAQAIAERRGLSVFIQTDPRGCALHLYRPADLDGRPIDECYSTRATAVCFPCPDR